MCSNEKVLRTDIAEVLSFILGIRRNVWYKLYRNEVNTGDFGRLCNENDLYILRNLTLIRTGIMRNFDSIQNRIMHELGLKINDLLSEYEEYTGLAIDYDYLIANSIRIECFNADAIKYLEVTNNYIEKQINKISRYFPDWLDFKYIRSLYIMPDVTNKELFNKEMRNYKLNKVNYPFQVYLYWPKDWEAIRYFLKDDNTIVTALYNLHGVKVPEKSLVTDADDATKENINLFIERGSRVSVAVDCENTDPFKFYSVIKSFSNEEIEKIERIVLYDDDKTSCAWDYVEKLLPLRVDHIEVDRVVENKSIVDMRLIAGVCEDHYKNNVDSFILVASDSDYWAMVDSLNDARFLVVYDKGRFSDKIKKKYEDRDIEYYDLSNFYGAEGEALRIRVLVQTLRDIIKDRIGREASEIAIEVYNKCKITYTTEDIKDFIKKYIETAKLSVEDGKLVVKVGHEVN